MLRVLTPELLDSDQGTSDEINRSFRDLERINRWFGGVHTTARLLRQVIRRTQTSSISVLDVAGARSQVVARAAKSARTRVRVTVMDRVPSHLPQKHGIAGDAMGLPFADSSFDVVHCCLFLHHLSDVEAVQFLKEALRVSRTAVLVNDLRRSPVHLGIVRLSAPLLFSRITQNDSVASVMRSYKIDEVQTLFKESGASSFKIDGTFFFRFAGVLWK